MPRVTGLCGSSVGLALGVVLAVDRHPLLGHHAGGQPQPEAEEVRWDRVQFQRAVRLCAMQKNRHRGDGDVRRHQREQHDLPPGRIGPKSITGQAQQPIPIALKSMFLRLSATETGALHILGDGYKIATSEMRGLTRLLIFGNQRARAGGLSFYVATPPQRTRPCHVGAATVAAVCLAPGRCGLDASHFQGLLRRHRLERRWRSLESLGDVLVFKLQQAARGINQTSTRFHERAAASRMACCLPLAFRPRSVGSGAISDRDCGATCPALNTARRPAPDRSCRPGA